MPTIRRYTLEEARTCFYQTFYTAWQDPAVGWRSIAGLDYEPKVVWENVDEETNQSGDTPSELGPPTDRAWVRAQARHTLSEMDSFGVDGEGDFEAVGTIELRVFVPINQQGLLLHDRICRVIARAFRGKCGPGDCCAIRFYRVRVNEQGPGERFFESVVLIDFEYEEDNT